ncbi:MAG: hydantoinase/oxoprolinase family protein [SAR324 cluster bacterium]|nr:hydantoinase/oxoprolinase family protein [SAR324 cluster bacterium]
MTSYLCGIDIGGTFTDCVVVDQAGTVITAKAPSTPGNFTNGMMAALTAAAEKLELSPEKLAQSITHLAHGTTVGTNAVVQKKGAKVGLITTRGHNDVIHIMRGSRGLSGRDVQKVVHFAESSKPDPIVPKRLIQGVSERVDCFGKIVVELNEEEVRQSIKRLVDQGVEAIAICFLWSFLQPLHERRVQQMVESMAPDLFVTCSSELIPKWGEYERTTAVALNAYIGPETTAYLRKVEEQLSQLGYSSPVQITQCAGGTIAIERAVKAPLLTLDSGPVSGVMGAKYIGEAMGYSNIITTDMGGTSFDVGVVFKGEPAFSFHSLVNQYEYFLPKVDIQAIGSGGGSKVWIDEVTGTLRVGPESAGAVPGPVCYQRGGRVATVTDADVVLGYLSPDHFASGTMQLDKAAAEAAIGEIADRLGMDLYECAAGIVKIADFQMADLIRKVTIQKGFDPRDFVLFAFGGAGPVHAGVFARELGVQKIIIPQRDTASVWCAFGSAAADILHISDQVDIMSSPFDPARLNAVIGNLKTQALEQLIEEGVQAEHQQFRFTFDMRHKGQIHEVEVEIDGDQIEAAQLEPLRTRFVVNYEQLYGKGASLPGAQLEIVAVRCRATAQTPKPHIPAAEVLTEKIPESAVRRPREVHWPDLGPKNDTPIYDGHQLVPGNQISGPAVLELEMTTVVLHPGQHLTVDAWGNFEIEL